MNTFAIASCAALIGLLLSDVLRANGYPERPPDPADASWRLLSDNLKETTQQALSTGATYKCDPEPEHIADVIAMGTPAGADASGLKYGRRLLDGYTDSVITDSLTWNFSEIPPPEVFVTFDLKRTYQIFRVDILLRTNEESNGFRALNAPAQVIYLFNNGDRVGENVEDMEGWVEKEPPLEFFEEDQPEWISSKFEPGPARFLRLRFVLKSAWLSVAEVRIWGAPFGDDAKK